MEATKPKIKRPPRPPPRLRTKTGCFKCRERRKKCCERRPICRACERLQIDCVYPESSDPSSISPSASDGSLLIPLDDAEASPIESLAALSPQISTLCLFPGVLKTARDWNIFQYCSTQYIKHLTSPEATSEFRDVSFVFAMGFNEPYVMHAALAPAALHASFAALIPKADAMIYTQSALQGLRQAIQTSTGTPGSVDTFLAASLFLGVFEDFYSSPSSVSLTHYRAIAHVLEEQSANISHLDMNQLSVFQLTLLDSLLYHFSTRLIFEKDIDDLCSSFPYQTISKYIDAFETDSRGAHQQAAILPVLGRTPPALFLYIYQLTWLSRQLPFDYDDNYAQALQCSTELENLRQSFPVVNFENTGLAGDVAGQTTLTHSEVSAKLYFLTTQIFLAKVLNPEGVCNDSPQIYGLLERGMDLLKLFDATAPCGQFICWPLLVLGCVACAITPSEARREQPQDSEELLRFEVRGIIQRTLVQIWKISYSGHVRRTAGALEKIWNLPSFLARLPEVGRPSSLEGQYDGLNALIYRNGLGPALLSPDDG